MIARKRMKSAEERPGRSALSKVGNFDIKSPEALFENRISESEIERESGSSEWLSPIEAAAYLRVSVGSLRNMTSNGELPFYKLGRRVRYLKEELRVLLLGKRKGAF